jgi:cytochrome c-type biogenesis protein CcmE
VQGTVEKGSLKSVNNSTNFVMIFNEKTIQVVYEGDPGGIFQECIPVVAQGRLVGDVFEATRIEVKHSNAYVADNTERLTKAEAQVCSPLVG